MKRILHISTTGVVTVMDDDGKMTHGQLTLREDNVVIFVPNSGSYGRGEGR
jgi:hypothetical protein